jgi:hypothetical protein
MKMRLRNCLVRLAVPMALIATSAVLAGWKWEAFPH